MNSKIPKNVDEYIAQFPEDVKAALSDLRRCIKQAAPDAKEKISYRMPYYDHFGRLAYFAAFKNHCSFFIMGKPVVKKFSRELKGFDVKGQTVHFTPKKPLPKALVKKIIKETMKLNEEKNKKKLKK